jgi:chemotaxis protein methyltransferase CheR
MTWSQPGFEEVARLVGMRTGLTFPPNRQDGAELGMRRAMSRTALRDVNEYRQRLATDMKFFDDLIDELTVGETYFFREPAQFELLRYRVIPEILQRRGPQHQLRAWSAGCASGEEAYSLAILGTELGQAGRMHLVATDISTAALARARRATFNSWSLRGDGAAQALPYLEKSGTKFVLGHHIQHLVAFAYLNLALDVYPSFATGIWSMDLILCRNVLIYFDAETIALVARRLFEVLAPGGWLFMASSDPPLAQLAPFEVEVTDAGVFCRRPLVGRLVPTVSKQSVLMDAVVDPPPAPMTGLAPSPIPHEEAARSTTDPLAEARTALHQGDCDRAAALTAGLLASPVAAVLHIQALANVEPGRAERTCADAALQHPLCAELHYLHAVLLIGLGREEDAARKLRQVIFLDRNLAMAHFTLGGLLGRRGDRAGARRAYRNARDLCASLPVEEIVDLSEGEPAGRMAIAAAHELALLDAAGAQSP